MVDLSYMSGVILIIVISAFALLGAVGLFAPGHIARYFGNKSVNRDQLSELRAVYGGLPLSIAAIGAVTLCNISPLTIQQALFFISILLLGMAAGRLFALCMQRPTKRSHVFLVLELLFGGVALYGFFT